ncbi:MAG: hypothetical protein JSV09_15240 [Thermoplasmata archaeon]|nr:MAG: hypothetical protein JSV09_15240 [Thermoplasmata archaeon]
MIGKGGMIYKIINSQKKSNLSLYLIVFILLLCSRIFDISTTYLATPNLSNESNIMVRALGLGWFNFIFMNIVIILAFFFLFRFSWSKFMKTHPLIDKYRKSHGNHRNISLEIGITLPIYVIITGYFQGLVNIMIYLKLIIVSFTNFLYLYPAIIGGVFGYISLYITKHVLYLERPRLRKKAHKVMIPKDSEKCQKPLPNPPNPI